MTYDWFHEVRWWMSSNGPLTIVTALPCHGISKSFQSSQNLVEFTFIIYGICILQDVCMESGHYITVIIFVLARLLYFLKWIIFLRGREEKVARFLFPLVEVIVVSPAWTIVKQNFALQIATLNKDVPISSRGDGQIRTFQRCEDILSDEEDIKCGKASLQVGSRLLTYKRVPKWRWFRHTHHCHHHHIIISSSSN